MVNKYIYHGSYESQSVYLVEPGPVLVGECFWPTLLPAFATSWLEMCLTNACIMPYESHRVYLVGTWTFRGTLLADSVTRFRNFLAASVVNKSV